MNILVISHRLPYPPNKGEKIRTYYQIKSLLDVGYSVTVYSPLDGPQDVANNEEFNQLPNLVSDLFSLPSKPIRLLKGVMTGASLSQANFSSGTMKSAVEQAIMSDQYDAILCTSSAMSSYVLDSKALPTRENKPLLLMDFMDLDSDKWRQYADKSALLMKLLYRRESRLVAALEQRSQLHFDSCYFISAAEVSLFGESCPQSDNIHVLGNGLNMKEFYPNPVPKVSGAEDPTFIFTGVMDYKPNVDAVLWFVENCWAQIRENFNDAQFIVAGMNPNEQIKELAKTPGIEVTGFVDDILPYYHRADIFVAPFRLARGVQNKVLQAFACGLPVVTTPMGAEGIPCEDGEHLLLANSPEQFITQILALTASTELTEKLKSNALTLIEAEFSWHGKLKPLMEQLAARGKANQGDEAL